MLGTLLSCLIRLGAIHEAFLHWLKTEWFSQTLGFEYFHFFQYMKSRPPRPVRPLSKRERYAQSVERLAATALSDIWCPLFNKQLFTESSVMFSSCARTSIVGLRCSNIDRGPHENVIASFWSCASTFIELEFEASCFARILYLTVGRKWKKEEESQRNLKQVYSTSLRFWQLG